MDINFPALLGMVSSLWGGGAVDSDPQAFLRHIYEPPASETVALAEDDIYSHRLLSLFDAYHDEARFTLTAADVGEAPVELVPFDPLSLGQSPRDLTISEPVVSDNRAMADIHFTSASGPVQLSVSMIEQEDGWRIDDVASFGGDQDNQWLLSWLLQYDPVGAR